MFFCFIIGGKKYCIRIPVLIRRWPWNGDPPWKHVGDWVVTQEPGPSPWKVNLPILATIAELVSHAEGDLKGRLQQVVRQEVDQMRKQLPEGAKLEMTEQRAGPTESA